MAVTFGAHGVIGSGPTLGSAAYPVGYAAGDLLFSVAINKPTSQTPNLTGSTWSMIQSTVVGSGAEGVDTGPIRISFFTRVATAGDVSSPPTLTLRIASVTGGAITGWMGYINAGAGKPLIVKSNGEGSSFSGTSISLAEGSVARVLPQAGDLLLGYYALTTDAAETVSARSVGATGLTVGTATSPVNGINGNGNMFRYLADYAEAITGTATGLATILATLSVSTDGGGIVIAVTDTDAGYGHIVLEDGSGNLELEESADDYLLDTIAASPYPFELLTPTPSYF